MFCPKCGAELPESSKFCPKCGTAINFSSEQTTQTTLKKTQSNDDVLPVNQTSTPMPNNEGICCPKCGASGCVPQYKQNVSGGGYGCLKGCLGAFILGPLGLLCGLCGQSVKSTNTLVWVCPKCGNEFTSRKDVLGSIFVQFLGAVLCVAAWVCSLGVVVGHIIGGEYLFNWLPLQK